MVETLVRTPMQIFSVPQHLVIPLFQRPYVWNEENQWEPLWQDIRHLADVAQRGTAHGASHFLGAIVVQQHETPLGTITASNVIDGQQRLTTLQLLMDAVAGVLEDASLDGLAGRLEMLTHNASIYHEDESSRLKIRHSNRDGAAYEEVMSAEPPVDHGILQYRDSLIVKAHAYFTRVARQWLGPHDEPEFRARADTLVNVLSNGLQLVAINLTASENSQEIFETLNARGTPLTAADLVKNYVFQRLAAERADTKRAYATLWPFESKFWEEEVSAGRYRISRSSLFLNQWLTSRTGEEIGPQSTFSRFKSWTEHDTPMTMADILKALKGQAELYERWTRAASDADKTLDRVELCVYRMAANDTEVLKPLLLWLHEPAGALPVDVISAVVSTCESWVMRRMLLRAPSGDLGRVVEDLIRTHRDAPSSELAQRIESHLARQNSTSTYWPGDQELRQALSTDAAYRRFRRGRLRSILEAVEDAYRAQTGQHQVPRSGLPIEHLLPQKWQEHWPVQTFDGEAERAAHVHRLGNLTLLTSSLNSAVSNGPWATKASALRKHDTLLMNSRLLVDAGDGAWDESAIDRRTQAMIDVILRTWPVPQGHVGEVVDPDAKPQPWIELRDLVNAGLITSGTELVARPGAWGRRTAVVREGGVLEMDGERFTTPSAAGMRVRGGATNGWHFWRLSDGRKLNDVRALFTGGSETRRTTDPEERDGGRRDWGPLHEILGRMPVGTWTSYGELARAIGSAAQPLGQHLAGCKECPNAQRVLRSDGTIAEGFAWTDSSDSRDPMQVLTLEGIHFTGGAASRHQFLTSDQLLALAE